MSLRVRIVLAIAVVLFFGAVVGVGVAGWQAKEVLHEELSAALLGGRQTIASAFEDLPRSNHPERDLRQLIATFDGNRHLAASLADPTGQLQLASRSARASPAPAWFTGLLDTHVAPSRVEAPLAGYGAIVLTPLVESDVGALWNEFLELTGVLIGAFLVGSVLVWLTVGRALGPLSDISLALVRIGSGDYGAEVPEEGSLELARLGRGVNEMAKRLATMRGRNLALEDQLRTLQDEERADLARDLHDEIGPHLFATNVDAAMARLLIEEGQSDEALRQLVAIQASVAHMQRLVREILGRLRPTELIELGLTAAVGEMVAFWRARQPAIDFAVRLPEDESIVPEPLRETLYRVVQEGLNNAVRHGRPRRIEIEISRSEEGDVIARVTDDGSPPAKPEMGGFGLIGMRERVAAARGRLDIDRGVGGGWSVTARLPVGDHGAEAA